jgi:hypothetical protein
VSREPGVGHVPPKSLRPRVIVVCTNGGRHKRRELLRLALIWDARGNPSLVQAMSSQPGRERRWTAIQAAIRADDGHQVVSRRCPLCPLHFKRAVVELTAEIAARPDDAPVEVDISGS